MATIRLNRQAAHSGQLPRVCICCGEPAQQLVQHTFRFEPTWLILLLTLFPKMWVFFSYDTFHLSLPVCSSHTTRFKWPSYAGLATAGLLLLMLVPIFAFYATGNHDKLIIMIPVVLLVIVGYVIARFVLLFGGPRVVRYSPGALELEGVSDAFAQHAGGGGPQYPQQPGYGGSYGVNYGAYPQGAYRGGGGSSKTLLIVGLVVGIPVVLIGMVGILAMLYGTSQRMQNQRWANQARRELAEEFRPMPNPYSQGRPSTGSPPRPPDKPVVATPPAQASPPAFIEGETVIPSRELASAKPPEPPASDFTPARSDSPPPTTAAEGTDFAPGDTAYFERFGKWYKARIVQKQGAVYELTFYFGGKQEVPGTQPAKNLRRTPPEGAEVVEGPASGPRAQRSSPAAAPLDSPLRSKEKPPVLP